MAKIGRQMMSNLPLKATLLLHTVVQCNLDLVTLLVSTKIVTKSHNVVAKLNIFL